MSSLTPDDLKNIAHLARLKLSPQDSELYGEQLTNILHFTDQLSEVNTDGIEPMAHPLDISQRLRPDIVTEINQRDKFQKIAIEVEAGLYLVPKVIE